MSTTQSKIKYVEDPNADLLFRLPDGTEFRVCRKYLAVSEAFESMLGASSDAQAERHAESGLPVAKLSGEETAEDMDVVLRFICRGQEKPDVAGMSVDQVARMWTLADKYGIDLIEELAAIRLLSLAPTHTTDVLAIALIHRHLSLTQATLPHMQGTLVVWEEDFISQIHHRQHLSSWREFEGRPKYLTSLPLEVWEQVGCKVMWRLVDLERMVYLGSKWADLAKQFSF